MGFWVECVPAGVVDPGVADKGILGVVPVTNATFGFCSG